jgi:hypothetical protein
MSSVSVSVCTTLILRRLSCQYMKSKIYRVLRSIFNGISARVNICCRHNCRRLCSLRHNG